MFSVTNPTVKLLLRAKNSEVSYWEEKQAEKIIKTLCKKLKKGKMLDELERGVTDRTSQTKCVTVSRYIYFFCIIAV